MVSNSQFYYLDNHIIDTGRFGRGEAELLLTWFEWIEVEVRGAPALLEGLCRHLGAVMKAATVGWGPRCLALCVTLSPRGGDGTCVPSYCSASTRDPSGEVGAVYSPRERSPTERVLVCRRWRGSGKVL